MMCESCWPQDRTGLCYWSVVSSVHLFLRERLGCGQCVWVILGCCFPRRRLLSAVRLSRPLWIQERNTH